MKVTICGAQSVGKTTLVDNLPEKYQKYVIKKVIRNVILKSDQEVKVNEEADAYAQTKFFGAYQNVLSERTDYITDRGLLDVAAYSNYLVYKRQIGSGIYFNQIQYIKDRLSKNKDEVFVYIPIEFDIVDDGFRSLDKKYQDECDRAIRMTLEDLGIEPIVICGTQEQRNKDFLKVLETIEKGKKPKSPNSLKPYKKLDIIVPQKPEKTTSEASSETNSQATTEFTIALEEAKKFWNEH